MIEPTDLHQEPKERRLEQELHLFRNSSVLYEGNGDDVKSRRCGGSDCDDNDPSRYPGNPETCDARGYDEDCDPSTYGDTDFDKDGLVSNQCCNRDERGNLNCGPDCDDSRYAIQIGTQICLPNSQNELKICGERGIFTCPQGQSCYEQPNGTGVCAPQAINSKSHLFSLRVLLNSSLPYVARK